MADQQSDHASLIATNAIYYEKKTLPTFEPKTQYFRMAPTRTDIPKMAGKTVYFTRYLRIAALYSDNTDEFTAQQSYLSAATVSAALHQRDSYVQLSKFATLTNRNDNLGNAVKRVTAQGAKTIDKLIRNDIGMCIADVASPSSVNMNNLAIDGGTLNSTGITARVWSHDASASGDRFPVYHNKTRLAQSATVVSFAKSALTIRTIQHAVSVLTSKDIDPLSDGNYGVIAHPEATYQITTNAGFKGWFAPTDKEPAKRNPSEVGIVAGAKIVHSTQAYKFSLSGDTLSTSSGAIYSTLVFGDGAYGATKLVTEGGDQGFKLYLKESGTQSTNDPTSMIKQVGFSVLGVGKVLDKSAGLWVLSTSKI